MTLIDLNRPLIKFLKFFVILQYKKYSMDDNFRTPDFDDIDFSLNEVETKNGSMDEIEEIFNYEKDSPTIQKELDIHNRGSQTEATKGFSLNDLGGSDDSNNLSSEAISSPQREEEEEQVEIEDYFESAEFIIFVTEAIILFGTNFYLKSNNLEKVTIEAFKKTASQQKALKVAWAKVLAKHNAKVSPEFELLLVLGAAYGMKINDIVSTQKAKKKLNVFEKPKPKPVEKQSLKVVKDELKDNPFKVDFENVEEETEVEEQKETVTKKEKPITPKGGIADVINKN